MRMGSRAKLIAELSAKLRSYFRYLETLCDGLHFVRSEAVAKRVRDGERE